MFTVLHRDTSGDETLYSVKTVRRAPMGKPDSGIYIETIDGGQFCIGFDNVHRCVEEPQPMIFVMNSAGATVATFHL